MQAGGRTRKELLDPEFQKLVAALPPGARFNVVPYTGVPHPWQERLVDVVWEGFGRPQGLAFDSTGTLYVADALAGMAGLYRVDVTQSKVPPELVLTAPALVGLAFDPEGGLVLAGPETVWRLDVPLSK